MRAKILKLKRNLMTIYVRMYMLIYTHIWYIYVSVLHTLRTTKADQNEKQT